MTILIAASSTWIFVLLENQILEMELSAKSGTMIEFTHEEKMQKDWEFLSLFLSLEPASTQKLVKEK